MKLGFLQRVASPKRPGRPSLLLPGLVAIAMVAASGVVFRLSAELDKTMEDVALAREEIDAAETGRALILREINALDQQRDNMLAHLRTVMEQEIVAGKWDSAVVERARALGHWPSEGRNIESGNVDG